MIDIKRVGEKAKEAKEAKEKKEAAGKGRKSPSLERLLDRAESLLEEIGPEGLQELARLAGPARTSVKGQREPRLLPDTLWAECHVPISRDKYVELARLALETLTATLRNDEIIRNELRARKDFSDRRADLTVRLRSVEETFFRLGIFPALTDIRSDTWPRPSGAQKRGMGKYYRRWMQAMSHRGPVFDANEANDII